MCIKPSFSPLPLVWAAEIINRPPLHRPLQRNTIDWVSVARELQRSTTACQQKWKVFKTSLKTKSFKTVRIHTHILHTYLYTHIYIHKYWHTYISIHTSTYTNTHLHTTHTCTHSPNTTHTYTHTHRILHNRILWRAPTPPRRTRSSLQGWRHGTSGMYKTQHDYAIYTY
jgi:hypothetical protein